MAAWEAIITLSWTDQLDCRYSDAEAAVVEWLDARGIELREAPSPREVLSFAVDVAEKHGIGRRALSNFDCFHYAHAKAGGRARAYARPAPAADRCDNRAGVRGDSCPWNSAASLIGFRERPCV